MLPSKARLEHFAHTRTHAHAHTQTHTHRLYYDPLDPNLSLVEDVDCEKLAISLLLKCGYGNNTHIVDNKKHYTDPDKGANRTRRLIYNIFQDINRLKVRSRGTPYKLNLDRWLLINGRNDPTCMSTQLTGNTCYFQVFLYAVLCKAGRPTFSR